MIVIIIIIIYRNFRQNLQEYFKKGKQNIFHKPDICPFCGKYSHCIIGWGYYERWAIDASGLYRIPIKIFKCKKAKRFISLQPTFLVPYKQATFHIIYRFLCLYFLSGFSMVKSIKEVSPSIEISYQNVQAWIMAFSHRCQVWITLLQTETGIVDKPEQGENKSARHLLMILQEYFGTSADPFGSERKYGELVNKYRGSPFTLRNYR